MRAGVTVPLNRFVVGVWSAPVGSEVGTRFEDCKFIGRPSPIPDFPDSPSHGVLEQLKPNDNYVSREGRFLTRQT